MFVVKIRQNSSERVKVTDLRGYAENIVMMHAHAHACFPVVSCYKRMRLTTSVYGNSLFPDINPLCQHNVPMPNHREGGQEGGRIEGWVDGRAGWMDGLMEYNCMKG